MRFIWGFVLMMVFNAGITCYAQTDSLVKSAPVTPHAIIHHRVIDSAELKLQLIADSMAMVLLKTPDPGRHSALIDSVLKVYAFNPYNLKFKAIHKNNIKMGTVRNTRTQWIILVVIGLVVYTAILVQLMSKDIYLVLMSFYSKRTLAKVSSQDAVLTSWAFIFLFLLFGLTIGLFIYLLTSWFGKAYPANGFQLFLIFSGLVILLFILKILTIRVLGFVFDIGRVVKDYISVLYLTYFNIAFVFLPLVICFSLLSTAYIPYLLLTALAAAGIIFLIQYLRSTVNIISNFRFHKIYLFIYLCALEICPILILIKALNL